MEDKLEKTQMASGAFEGFWMVRQAVDISAPEDFPPDLVADDSDEFSEA